jgi:hypothetical protein
MTTMFPFKLRRRSWMAVLGGLAALSLALGAVAPAFAAEAAPPAPDPARRDERLSRLLERELNWLEAQADHLARAGEAAGKVQDFIDTARAEGKDTAGLEAALVDFQATVAEAQAAHDEAHAILDARAGFDAQGQVVDARQARETLADAGRALRDGHFHLRQAERELRQEMREFRRENRPRPAGMPTPQP